MDNTLYYTIIIFCITGIVNNIVNLWITRIDETLRENIRSLHRAHESDAKALLMRDNAILDRDNYIKLLSERLNREARDV